MTVRIAILSFPHLQHAYPRVIPAQAGIQKEEQASIMDPCLRRDDTPFNDTPLHGVCHNAHWFLKK